MPKDRSQVAFVCTGNTCRSPMAEAIFNDKASKKALSVRAESFGLQTVTGLPVSENAAEACREIGVNLSLKRSVSSVDVSIKKYSRFYCMSNAHAEALRLGYGVPADKITVLDIDDPYGGDMNVYRHCRDEILSAVEKVIEEYEN